MPESRIEVLDSDGEPVRGARVVIGFFEGQSEAGRSDSDGVAMVHHESTGEATVFVNGAECGSFYAPGETTVRT